MAHESDAQLLTILAACDQAKPLYPMCYVRETQIPRADLDRALDELRGLGLVEFTD